MVKVSEANGVVTLKKPFRPITVRDLMSHNIDHTHLLAQLRDIVGADHVLTHEDPATDLSAWEQDWRKRERGHALA
ncbi:MAG: hypothetical protein ABI680_04770, partial [Chthoniobacteraceae bacterium]